MAMDMGQIMVLAMIIGRVTAMGAAKITVGTDSVIPCTDRPDTSKVIMDMDTIAAATPKSHSGYGHNGVIHPA